MHSPGDAWATKTLFRLILPYYQIHQLYNIIDTALIIPVAIATEALFLWAMGPPGDAWGTKTLFSALI